MFVLVLPLAMILFRLVSQSASRSPTFFCAPMPLPWAEAKSAKSEAMSKRLDDWKSRQLTHVRPDLLQQWQRQSLPHDQSDVEAIGVAAAVIDPGRTCVN